jgi:hypothetical protein
MFNYSAIMAMALAATAGISTIPLLVCWDFQGESRTF